MRFYPFVLFIILFLSQKVTSQTSFNLTERDDRIKYLQAIFSTDQAIRYYEDSVMLASGWQSEAHKLAIDSLQRVDSALTLKIDQYLNTYGYPELKYYGEKANMTPWLILQHSSLAHVRKKQFGKLYRAYKDENLEQRRLIDFLEREYRERFAQDFRSYSLGDLRIKELINELELKRI